MIAMTTSSSISVKALRPRERETRMGHLQMSEKDIDLVEKLTPSDDRIPQRSDSEYKITPLDNSGQVESVK